MNTKCKNTNAIDAYSHDTHHTQNDTDHVSNIFKEKQTNNNNIEHLQTTETHKQRCPMIREVQVTRKKRNMYERQRRQQRILVNNLLRLAAQIRPYGSHAIVICSMKYYRSRQNFVL